MPQDNLTLTATQIVSITGGALLKGTSNQAVTALSTDSRTLQPSDLFIPLVGSQFDGHRFIPEALNRGACGYLTQEAEGGGRQAERTQSGDCPLVIQVADTLAAYQDLARAWRQQVGAQVVAITGSAGKTTTKEMTAALIGSFRQVLKSEANLNNEVGVPLTLLQLERHHEVAVVELAMRASGEIGQLAHIAQPDVAVITNVGLTHVGILGSKEAIAAAKCEVIDGLKPGGWLIMRAEDEDICQPYLKAFPRNRHLRFSTRDQQSADVRAIARWRESGRMALQVCIERPVTRSITVLSSLAGEHQAANALCAVAAALCLGIELPDAVTLDLPDLPGRAHWRTIGSWRLFDDSYNANPEAMRAAYSTFAEDLAASRPVLVLGEMLELGDRAEEEHRALGRWLGERVAQDGLLLTVGPMAGWIGGGARKQGLPATQTPNFPDNVAAARAMPSLLRPGDAIFLKGSRGARLEAIIPALAALVPG